MANPEHVAKLEEGVAAWNKWRNENKDVEPDFFDADLSGFNLPGINLSKANLSEATLTGADLSKAYLPDTELVGADLTKVNLSGANLSGAILSEADLTKVNLSDVNFSKAILSGTNFQNAVLKNTRFSSREDLISLHTPLTEEQLAGAVFQSEKDFYAKAEKTEASDQIPSLRIKFDDNKPWTPYYMARFLMALQMTHTRIYYLVSTTETDLTAMAQGLTGRISPDQEEQDIQIAAINSGSLELIISTLGKSPTTKTLLCLWFTAQAFQATTAGLNNLSQIVDRHLSSQEPTIETVSSPPSGTLPATLNNASFSKETLDTIKSLTQSKQIKALHAIFPTNNRAVIEHPQLIDKAIEPLVQERSVQFNELGKQKVVAEANKALENIAAGFSEAGLNSEK